MISDFDPEKKIKEIIEFLERIFTTAGLDSVVIGLSGGIDSTTSLYLLNKIVPKSKLFVYHLYYYKNKFENINLVKDKLKIPDQNLILLDIKPMVDSIKTTLNVSEEDKIRLGNIMARVRMITLFDQAKMHNALVCGTENKSENYLSYFTRYGDEASDIEPILSLYKSQVFELAKHLGVPNEIINQPPSADLWQGQSDEDEFGFSYKIADEILYLYYEQNKSKQFLVENGYEESIINQIISWVKEHEFKHKVPYKL